LYLLAHLPLPHTVPRLTGLPTKLFDHTLSADFIQYKHLLRTTVAKFAMMTIYGHDHSFRAYANSLKIMSQNDLRG